MFGFIKTIFIGLLTSIVNASCQNLHSQVINGARLNLLLSIYILMNTVKDYITIHLGLTQIDMSEVAILLMTYPIPYTFQIKAKSLSFFKMITAINESKILTKYVSCKCERKSDGRKLRSNQNSDNYKRRCDCKNLKK